MWSFDDIAGGVSKGSLRVYRSSLHASGGVTFFMASKDEEKFIGCIGEPILRPGHQVGELKGQPIYVGPLSHENAVTIRRRLPWTAPRTLGLATSFGFGDRLGLATPGHIRSVRGSGLAPIFAQQSIREMTRTQRTPDEVMDAATWGVLQEGWTDGFGSDGDHLQKPEDIDYTLASGFTLFTIDPGAHVENAADTDDAATLQAKSAKVDLATLDASVADLTARYVGKVIDLGGTKINFDQPALMRAIVKYGNAIAHTVKMYRHLASVAKTPFELEVSVDETASPTTPGEHYFFANELKRCGVKWVSMAPRFIGRFEKGVDYIGDTDAFAKSFAEHVAVMKAIGPYKMSIHSGSDKFSIYPIVAQLAGPYVHVKTAGTSWLEAVRAIGTIDPALFKQVLDFAHERYETDKASYHVSADASKVPHGAELSDAAAPSVLDGFDGRQLLHVTFGSILTAKKPDGSSLFRDRILSALRRDEETHYDVLQRHLGRHVQPFVKGK